MIHMGVDCQQKCGKVKFKLKQHQQKNFPFFHENYIKSE